MKQKDHIPKHLEPAEAELFESIKAEYAIQDAAGLALLSAACESAMTARQCRERIALDGLVNEKGRPHPLCAVMRDARNSFLACIRQLGLDTVSAGSVGAPIGNSNALSTLKRIK
ncbi:MAG: P27 family phage terminase small subunit [Thiobacillaceae bacterium]